MKEPHPPPIPPDRIEAEIHAYLDAAPDAMLVVDQQARIVLINRQTETLFGYSRSELIGQSVESLIPRRYRSQHPRHRSNFVAASKVRPMGSGLELFGLRKDGSEFPAEISLSPLATEGGVVVISAIRDVTERKLAEAQIRKLNEWSATSWEKRRRTSRRARNEVRLYLPEPPCVANQRAVPGSARERGGLP